MKAEGWKLGHVPALDGVRGVAILIVVLYHAGFPIQGYLGVDIFFVLSGFLITSLLVAEHAATGRVRLSRFYWRRVLRLAPALAAMLIVAVVYAAVAGDGPTMRSIPYAAAYAYNWAIALGGFVHNESLLTHTWSLAIEEQFYLVWPPVLLLLLARGGRRWAAGGAVALAAASAVARVAVWDGANMPRVYFGADVHADGLLIGCAAALLLSARGGQVRLPRRAVGLSAAVVLVGLVSKLLVGTAYVPLMVGGGWTLFSLAAAVLVLHVVVSPSSRLAAVLASTWLVRLGAVSYGLYLWHTPLFALGDRTASPLGNVLLTLVATPLAVWASYRFIEAPFLRMKNRQGHTEGRGSRDLHPDRVGHRGHRLPAMAGQATAS